MVHSAHFDGKLGLDPRAFYLLELGQPASKEDRNGWVRFKPFCHKSDSGKSLAVNLRSGPWICFAGCGKGGSPISFVMWRYRFSFPEALKHLGIHRTAIRPRRNDPPKSVLRLLAEAVVYGPLADPARVERIRWRNELETSMGLYRQTNRRLAELARGAAEAYEGEREDCWALLPLLLQDIRLSEKLYAEACED